jgi:5S rRNA maturation endonuclease (ribonuclease M5)
MTMTYDPATFLLSKLDKVRFSAGSWMACCPAHEDGKASLHISRGKDHPLVLKCMAGCATEDILAAVGLTWETLCAPRDDAAPKGEWTPRGDALAVYDYTDETGKLLFQVLRTADKQFSQRSPDKSRPSGWRWTLGNARRVPYRLPKLIEAVKAGEVIYVAEGEKDVQAIEAAGATATCNPGGAGKWRQEFSEYLRDAVVVIVADRDKPGLAHARQVAASLDGIATAVEIVESECHKDAAAHLGAGLSLAQLEVTWQSGVDEVPDLAPDLYDFMGETDPPQEWVIPHLLEYGDRLIWTGREGLGKSVAVRQIAMGAAAGIHPFTNACFPPKRVLLIDCENPQRLSRRAFRNLDKVTRVKQRPVPPGGFRIIHRPEGVNLGREDEVAWLLERVTAHKPDLLVIGPLYKLHVLDINDELAARTVVAGLDAAMARTGCALIVEAHAPHGEPGRRPLRPVGSSLFMRWPEFGFGIAPANGVEVEGSVQQCRHVKVRPWRGLRDEREWPFNLTWGDPGSDWPWVPCDKDGVRDERRYPFAVEDVS